MKYNFGLHAGLLAHYSKFILSHEMYGFLRGNSVACFVKNIGIDKLAISFVVQGLIQQTYLKILFFIGKKQEIGKQIKESCHGNL